MYTMQFLYENTFMFKANPFVTDFIVLLSSLLQEMSTAKI